MATDIPPPGASFRHHTQMYTHIFHPCYLSKFAVQHLELSEFPLDAPATVGGLFTFSQTDTHTVTSHCLATFLCGLKYTCANKYTTISLKCQILATTALLKKMVVVLPHKAVPSHKVQASHSTVQICSDLQ